MENNNKVTVVSTVNAQVGLHLPEYKINRVWPKKGSKVQIDKDVLAEAMYEPGVASMFRKGILYIEDMETKKELGLEPDDATEPENIIVLTDAQMIRLLKVAPIKDMKEMMNKLSKQQKENLAYFAVENEIADMDKADILKEATGIDVINFIRMNRDAKKAEAEGK